MATTRSITEEDGEDVKREISVKLTQVMRYTERLDQKMNIMIALANTLPNEDDKKEFMASTETAKDDHDNLKKRFADFVYFYHFEEDSTLVFPQIEAFMKQELDKNDKLRQLCVKFLSEEDQNYLDFLSDEEENSIGFPPLEPSINEGFGLQQANRGKSKLISNDDCEESVKEFEAIKKDGFLKKLEGSSSETKEHEDENISKIQEKLHSLKLPGVSNQDEDKETSLKEWLKQAKNGNEDRNPKNATRVLAIDLAASLSRQLLEFMIIMPDQQGIMEKLRKFKSTLKATSQDNDKFLIKKMICVMEMVDNEAIDKKTKAGASDFRAESQVDEFIDLFFDLLMDLESIIAFPSLPDSIKLMERSESDLERCKAQLKEVESKVYELKKHASGDFEYEKLASLEMRIVVMWDQVEREEMGEEQPGTVEYSYPMQLFLKM